MPDVLDEQIDGVPEAPDGNEAELPLSTRCPCEQMLLDLVPLEVLFEYSRRDGRSPTVLVYDDQSYAGVGDALDGTGVSGGGLDTDTVGGALDGGGLEGDVFDGVVGATADTADGETVAAGAGTAAEGDVLSRR